MNSTSDSAVTLPPITTLLLPRDKPAITEKLLLFFTSQMISHREQSEQFTDAAVVSHCIKVTSFCEVVPFVGTVMISCVHRLAVAGWKGGQHITQ